MTARTKARRSAIAVADLPHDVVVNIVGHVASCKAMYKASKEGTVGRHVALEQEEAMKWLDNERYLAVINHLAGVGNPEACFIVGLLFVFVHQDMQRGLMCPEQAADASHKAAAYMLGLLFYTASEAHDVGKHYISQVKGELADGGCKTAKRTNRECRRCRRLAADAIQEVAWKMAGPLGWVWALSEDDHWCMSTSCGVTEGWDDYVVFCSDECRIRHEYAKFFAHVLNYLL